MCYSMKCNVYCIRLIIKGLSQVINFFLVLRIILHLYISFINYNVGIYVLNQITTKRLVGNILYFYFLFVFYVCKIL